MLQIEQRDAQPPDVLNTRVATGEWEYDFPFFVVLLYCTIKKYCTQSANALYACTHIRTVYDPSRASVKRRSA